MEPVLRFAPSPTGLLHVGNMRTALVNWLYAKKIGGKFLLRLDDTDLERSKEEYNIAIREDLTWLGLHWDDSFCQSERLALYDAAKQRLLSLGRLYPCYESEEELDVKRKMQLSRGQPPLYDRGSLKLTSEKIAAYEAEGRKPHYRFLMSEKPIIWEDMVRGRTEFDGRKLSDPVLQRADGTYTYMMPSTVDDLDKKITHIIRGEDHVTNTAIQIQIFDALGAPVPVFGHLSLVTSKDAAMSKRTGGFDIRSLRDKGIAPQAITSFLAKVGTADPIDFYPTLQTLVDSFDIGRFGRAPTQYDPEELDRLTAKYYHQSSFAEIAPQLQALGLGVMDESFWNTVHGNIAKISELKDWWEICKEPITPVLEDPEFTKQISTLLPSGSWNEETWSAWINAIKAHSDKKGKALFMPIRKALTAREDGPELKFLLPLIGPEKTAKRLCGVAA